MLHFFYEELYYVKTNKCTETDKLVTYLDVLVHVVVGVSHNKAI